MFVEHNKYDIWLEFRFLISNSDLFPLLDYTDLQPYIVKMENQYSKIDPRSNDQLVEE